MADGHLGKCSDCTKRDTRIRLASKIKDPVWLELERERCRIKGGGGKYDRVKDYIRKRKDPLKLYAHRMIERYVHSGKIVKPSVCSTCGNLPKRFLHGHHDDYTKPLVVRFICELCHGKEHRKL
jgi:hypothetical protein